MTARTPGGHALGLIPDAPDHRDLMRAVAPVPYAFVDLEPDPATPPVWDQGQLGSCTAHGTLACFMWASSKCGAGDPTLSRLMAYYLTRQIGGNVESDSGGQIRDAIKASTMGIAPETDWPYDITRFADEPPAQAYVDARDNVDLSYARVGTDENSIQSCLSEGFPVDIGVILYPSFEAPESIASGVVGMPGLHDKMAGPVGAHCMAVWGIGTGVDWKAHGQFADADDETLYVKLRNSWGDGVYQRGYLAIPAAYLANYGTDFWTIRRVS